MSGPQTRVRSCLDAELAKPTRFCSDEDAKRKGHAESDRILTRLCMLGRTRSKCGPPAPSTTVLLFCSILDFAYQDETRMAMLNLAELNGLLRKGVMQFASQYRPTRQTVREGFEPSVAF